MGVAERKQREKEKRHNEILDAAEELFFSQSLQQTTMDQVAERTELSKGTLYLYFRSKDELYLAINLRAKRLLRQHMEAALLKAQKLKGLEQALQLGEAFLAFSQTYPDYAQVIQDCQIPEGELLDSNVYAREAHEHGERSLKLLIQVIGKGQQDGSIRAELEPAKTALLLWAQLTGLLQLLAAKGEYLNQLAPVAEIKAYAFTLSRLVLSPAS